MRRTGGLHSAGLLMIVALLLVSLLASGCGSTANGHADESGVNRMNSPVQTEKDSGSPSVEKSEQPDDTLYDKGGSEDASNQTDTQSSAIPTTR